MHRNASPSRLIRSRVAYGDFVVGPERTKDRRKVFNSEQASAIGSCPSSPFFLSFFLHSSLYFFSLSPLSLTSPYFCLLPHPTTPVFKKPTRHIVIPFGSVLKATPLWLFRRRRCSLGKSPGIRR